MNELRDRWTFVPPDQLNGKQPSDSDGTVDGARVAEKGSLSALGERKRLAGAVDGLSGDQAALYSGANKADEARERYLKRKK